jgi:hypothetical protein
MCCCRLWRKAIHARRREAPARLSPGPAFPWALGGQWGLAGTPPRSSSRRNAHQPHDAHLPHGWIGRLRSSIKA